MAVKGKTNVISGNQYEFVPIAGTSISEVIKSANRLFRELFSKVYGRIANQDLGTSTKEYLNNKLDKDDLVSQLEQSADVINTIISVKGTIITSKTAPSNPQKDDFWLDISEHDEGVLKRYNGTRWEVTTSQYVETAGMVIRNADVHIFTSAEFLLETGYGNFKTYSIGTKSGLGIYPGV